MKITDYSLPDWAFLDGYSQDGDLLEGRTLVLHVKSASIIELIHEPVNFSDDTIAYLFSYKGKQGKESITAALHYCSNIHSAVDEEFILEEVLKPCSEWYKEYLVWLEEEA